MTSDPSDVLQWSPPAPLHPSPPSAAGRGGGPGPEHPPGPCCPPPPWEAACSRPWPAGTVCRQHHHPGGVLYSRTLLAYCLVSNTVWLPLLPCQPAVTSAPYLLSQSTDGNILCKKFGRDKEVSCITFGKDIKEISWSKFGKDIKEISAKNWEKTTKKYCVQKLGKKTKRILCIKFGEHV